MPAKTSSECRLEWIREVVRIEREALGALEERIDASFCRAVDRIYEAPGRLIVCGLGKSGFIARKIAATLTSTGTPSFYVHPVEGAHGDFGLIQEGDVALVLSKSGAGDELNLLLPFLKRTEIPVIAITHDLQSPLAEHSEIVLDGSIELEACPNGIAPTTSSTVALVIGDALAVALMRRKGFSRDDFARFHPAGALGRKLLLRAIDVIPEGRELPGVRPEDGLAEVILSISEHRVGATLVRDNDRLLGLITDGDLRRHMLDPASYAGLTAAGLMSKAPRTFPAEHLAAEALAVLNRYKIQQLVLCDEQGKPCALLHLHDLLSQGIR